MMVKYSVTTRNRTRVILRESGNAVSFVELDEKYNARVDKILSVGDQLSEEVQWKLQTIYLYLMAIGEQIHAA